MEIDWNKVWQEFNEELEGYLRSGKPNEWRVQQDMIRGAVERNLTTGAADVLEWCGCEGNPPTMETGKCSACGKNAHHH